VLRRLGVGRGQYFVASAHRAENVDDPRRLRRLIACLQSVGDQWSLPVLVSTHPRTRKRVQDLFADSELDGLTFCDSGPARPPHMFPRTSG
jgi:UDP-N-acetylglucosamine 2-epimerase (non-hydrolysing)